ncbi:MAG: PRC-barrel domain-containing protein [Clostridia bacterium]|nr:PRC-barrel domain-containing protein [Clostridia bacterium]MDD4679426.1 PRC-barrel domain-containing protein [Clostridia bacterium]
MDRKRASRIKRESVLGLPVIDGSTGKKLGVVKDFYAAKQSTQLQGFYVVNKALGGKTMGLPFHNATIGYDAVMVEGELIKSHNQTETENEELKKLLNKKVVREDGVDLGIISDIILDPLTGRIEGLELSESVFEDLMAGRRILPYEPYEYINGDILVITMEQAESIDSSNRGIKNILFNRLE